MTNNLSLGDFNNWLRFISAGIYLASLTQPSFCTTQSCIDGIEALIDGMIGFYTSFGALTWLANPLIFISWALIYKNPQRSLYASIIALLISLSFLFFKRLMVDEAGHYGNITAYKLGYWLWVLSSFIIVAGNLYVRIKTFITAAS